MSELMTTKMLPRSPPNLSKQWPVSRKTRKFTKEAHDEERLFDRSFGLFRPGWDWSVRTRPPAQGRPGSVMYQILDQYRNISNIFLTGLSDTTRTQPKRQSIFCWEMMPSAITTPGSTRHGCKTVHAAADWSTPSQTNNQVEKAQLSSYI